MPKATLIRELTHGWRGTAYLYKMTRPVRYFAVSGVDAYFDGWEVLVLPADKDGKVVSWRQVAGGRGYSFAEAVADMEAINPKPCHCGKWQCWDHEDKGGSS